MSPANPEDAVGIDDTGSFRWSVAPRTRGSWRVDEQTGDLIEMVRADSYAEQKEREALELRKASPKPSIVKI